MMDPLTPQYRALTWLTNEDGLQLNLDETADASLDLVQISQQYILSVIYFSKDGHNWQDQINFLTPTSECTWEGSESTENEVYVRIGVTCNGESVVPRLDLCKYRSSWILTTAFYFFECSTTRHNSFRTAMNNLTETIAEEVSSLTWLQRFSMGINPSMRGTIPSALFETTQLQDLRLLDCSLTGRIPNALGEATALTYLALQNNLFYFNHSM
jgi:hypothetical protein